MIENKLDIRSIEFTSNMITSLYSVLTSIDAGSITKTFNLLDSVASLAMEQLEKARRVQAMSLWLVSELWDKLPYEITLQWHDYMDWARQRTGYDDSTVYNYIRAARVWYNPGLILNKTILFDGDGNEMIDGIDGSVVSINPDPLSVSISKLILSATAFENGELTEVQIGQIFNNKVSFGQLYDSMKKQRMLNSGRPITRFFLDGVHLMIVEDGQSEAFGELYLYDIGKPLIRKGVDHILIASGIVRP